MKRVVVLLLTAALIAGMVGCPADPEPTPPVEYSLTTSSSEGGEVTTPGEAVFVYGSGEVVSLVAAPASGYYFGGWTGDVSTIANTRAASTTITMNGDYSITADFQVIPFAKYSLTVSSTEGGSVTVPGEGSSVYNAGTVVELAAEAAEGYQFTYWTGSVGAVDDVNAASTTVTMMGDYTITANFAKEIRNWYDLDAIRDNLSGHYVLVNDLDSTTSGYAELAGPTANEGRGWQPIGGLSADPSLVWLTEPVQSFAGGVDGRGYEIRHLFVGRPDDVGVGLFGFVDEEGVVENLRVVSGQVTGDFHVGGLVGWNNGTVTNAYYGGSVTGNSDTGALVGWNSDPGTVSSSYASCSVSGTDRIGGLLGWNSGNVRDCHFGGTVTGKSPVGGLVGHNWGRGIVSNSYYNYDEVRINAEKVISIGALFAEDFDRWLANDRSLAADERLAQEDGYYLITDVNDFMQLLALGQDGSLRFRLKNDLDLGGHPNLYIPYLAGEFDGVGHRISNVHLDFGFVGQVGLFGHLASGARVTNLGVENADITARGAVGGLVGSSHGNVNNCYFSGSVKGVWDAGGLAGVLHHGALSNCYFSGSVTTQWGSVGGLVGRNDQGTVTNSHYDHDQVLINRGHMITTGALSGKDFEQWLDNGKFLDVNDRLSKSGAYYVISDASDFRQLLAFGQDSSLRFRLESDLDLRDEPNFYIPYLAGEFDGNNHRVVNLRVDLASVWNVGLFGYLAAGARVVNTGIENAKLAGTGSVGGLVGHAIGQSSVGGSYVSGSVIGRERVGGLVGWNDGTVSDCCFRGIVTGHAFVGGLAGFGWGTVANSCSSGSVSGESHVGGLIGANWHILRNSYSVGSVNGDDRVGGLVGHNAGTVLNSFWNTQTSGQSTSAGGIGKATTEMKSIDTFRTAGWSIVGVAAGVTDRSQTWNIVDGETYPFLSWQQFP